MHKTLGLGSPTAKAISSQGLGRPGEGEGKKKVALAAGEPMPDFYAGTKIGA